MQAEAAKTPVKTTLGTPQLRGASPATNLANLEKASVAPLSVAFAQTTSLPKAAKATAARAAPTTAMRLPAITDTAAMEQELKTRALGGHEMPKQATAPTVSVPLTTDMKTMNEQMMTRALGGHELPKQAAAAESAPSSISTMMSEMREHALAGHKAEADAIARLEKMQNEAVVSVPKDTQAPAASTADRLQDAAAKIAQVSVPIAGLAKGVAAAPQEADPMAQLADIQVGRIDRRIL
jgi:hypothetical protein